MAPFGGLVGSKTFGTTFGKHSRTGHATLPVLRLGNDALLKLVHASIDQSSHECELSTGKRCRLKQYVIHDVMQHVVSNTTALADSKISARQLLFTAIEVPATKAGRDGSA